MLKEEFDPLAANWWENKSVWLDLGYQGFEKNYKASKVQIPIKRPRRKSKEDPKIELTVEQKQRNREVGAGRIYVEHSIGGMKRYRILSNRLRCRDTQFYAMLTVVCAGLWIFQLKH